ncbi:MAG TPA: hypothetical protein PLO89_01640 [Spirochaetota bacterium]|nr:hypothetical protein [Spirochaetota bacterium]
MNKNLKEKLINQIKEKYENNSNFDLEEKIELDMKITSSFDPALEEYKKDIYNAIKKNLSTNDIKSSRSVFSKQTIEEFEDLEEIEEIENDEKTSFDLEIIEKIDNKVLSILQYLNMEIYNIKDLKETIINDMLGYLYSVMVDNNSISEIINDIPQKINPEIFIQELKKISSPDLKIFFSNCYKIDDNDKKHRYIDQSLSDQDKIKLWSIFNSILWYIEKHIDYEFNEREKRKIQIKKDLWAGLLKKIAQEIEERLALHKKNRIKNVTKIQVTNFLNFLFDEIDNKYIKVDKKEKKLNNEDYLFLKKKTKEYIQRKYFTK